MLTEVHEIYIKFLIKLLRTAIAATFVFCIIPSSHEYAFAEPKDVLGEADNALGETNEFQMNTVSVEDIELGDYKNRMLIGDTQELAATVLPRDATDQTVSFSSSNVNIATVSSSGNLKAVGEGNVIIQISAGAVTKRIYIEVCVKTLAIVENQNFLVLPPGGTFKLEMTVVPNNAPKDFIYTSTNKNVAEVSGDGTVKAKNIGGASIIVSNGDASVAITVLVNGRISEDADETVDNNDQPTELPGSVIDLSEKEAALIDEILNTNGIVRIRQLDWPIISPNILKALYDTRSTLIIESSSYMLLIAGEKIQNRENSLYTGIQFEKSGDNVTFIFNQEANLPGEIEIAITNDALNRKYLYLFNSAKNAYQRLDSKTDASFVLNEAGHYCLSNERIEEMPINWKWLGLGAGVLLLGIMVFIIIKKRYWFW